MPSVAGVVALNSSTSVTVRGSGNIRGDVYLFGDAKFSNQGNARLLAGSAIYYENNNEINLGKSPDTPTYKMLQSELKLRDDIVRLKEIVESLPKTQGQDNQNISSGVVFEASSDPNSRINVISLGNISIPSTDSMTLRGSANSIFIIKVSGSVSFGKGVLLDGVSAGHVLFYISGTGTGISISGQGGVSGTFLAPNRTLSFTGQGKFKGALISGASSSAAIDVGGNGSGDEAQFNAEAFCGE